MKINKPQLYMRSSLALLFSALFGISSAYAAMYRLDFAVNNAENVSGNISVIYDTRLLQTTTRSTGDNFIPTQVTERIINAQIAGHFINPIFDFSYSNAIIVAGLSYGTIDPEFDYTTYLYEGFHTEILAGGTPFVPEVDIIENDIRQDITTDRSFLNNIINSGFASAVGRNINGDFQKSTFFFRLGGIDPNLPGYYEGSATLTSYEEIQTPIPAAFWLMGSGLAVVLKKRKRKFSSNPIG